MGNVQLKIAPWAASVWNLDIADPFILEKETTGPITVTQLLTELASRHPEFRKILFGADGMVSDGVMIVLNGVFLPSPDASDIKIEGGDTILLLPAFAGG